MTALAYLVILWLVPIAGFVILAGLGKEVMRDG